MFVCVRSSCACSCLHVVLCVVVVASQRFFRTRPSSFFANRLGQDSGCCFVPRVHTKTYSRSQMSRTIMHSFRHPRQAHTHNNRLKPTTSTTCTSHSTHQNIVIIEAEHCLQHSQHTHFTFVGITNHNVAHCLRNGILTLKLCLHSIRIISVLPNNSSFSFGSITFGNASRKRAAFSYWRSLVS